MGLCLCHLNFENLVIVLHFDLPATWLLVSCNSNRVALACPVDIKVRCFTRKLNKDALDLYECEAGLSIEERPPLDTYRPDDYDEFIR